VTGGEVDGGGRVRPPPEAGPIRRLDRCFVAGARELAAQAAGSTLPEPGFICHDLEEERANRSIAGRRGSRHMALKHSIVVRHPDSAIWRAVRNWRSTRP